MTQRQSEDTIAVNHPTVAISAGRPEAQPPMAAAPQPHLAAVDGLRAVACLAVVAFHCFLYGGQILWPHLSLGRRDLTLAGFLAYGYLGVELFFVLSGFCLAYPILRHPERPHDWKRYFYNRARRIYPAYWGALLLLSALAVLIAHAHVAALLESRILVLPPLRRFCLSLVNPETDLNGSFWTLKIELRWYLLLPLLLVLHRRTKSVGLMGLAAVVSVAYALTLGAHPESKISNLVSPLPLYLPLFVAGIWIAEVFALGRPTRLEAALIRHARWGAGLSCLIVWIVTPSLSEQGFHHSRVVPGGLLASFLLLLLLYDPFIRKVLSWHPPVATGLFSYSLYLIHQPLIELVLCRYKAPGLARACSVPFLPVCRPRGLRCGRVALLPSPGEALPPSLPVMGLALKHSRPGLARKAR